MVPTGSCCAASGLASHALCLQWLPAQDVTNTVFYAEIGQLMMRQPLVRTGLATEDMELAHAAYAST